MSWFVLPDLKNPSKLTTLKMDVRSSQKWPAKVRSSIASLHNNGFGSTILQHFSALNLLSWLQEPLVYIGLKLVTTSQLLPKIWPQKGPKILQKWIKSPKTVEEIHKNHNIKLKTHFIHMSVQSHATVPATSANCTTLPRQPMPHVTLAVVPHVTLWLIHLPTSTCPHFPTHYHVNYDHTTYTVNLQPHCTCTVSCHINTVRTVQSTFFCMFGKMNRSRYLGHTMFV
jgi:hypothetical protein